MHRAQNRSKLNNLGFTLVELIVVIIILGILASAAIYGISGYIDMTRFNKNQQNALSVFQSAQAAVNHMEEAGIAEDWSKHIISIGTKDEYNAANPGAHDNVYNSSYFDVFPTNPDTQSGQSVHMRYAVTLTPGASDAQSECIKALIGDDFKSSDTLKALITIEFDIEKTLDNAGKVRYSANVYSVFYDSKRTSWDNVAKNNITSVVPFRDTAYRRATSLIGYSNPSGTASAVDTVYIPADSEIKNTIVTLRNGETLDLTWSATADTEPVTGKPAQIHYTFSLYDDDSGKKFCDLVVNESNILGGVPRTNASLDLIPDDDNFYEKLKFTADDYKNNAYENKTVSKKINGTIYTVVYSSENVSDQRGIPINIYRATLHTTAKVFVRRHTGTDTSFDYNTEGAAVIDPSNYYTFPLAVSYEVHEGDGVSDRISYSLSLDAMMSRNVTNNAGADTADYDSMRSLNYSINRLFGYDKLTKDKAPKNFYAIMVAAPNAFTAGVSDDYNDTTHFATSDAIYAERALDDPVYLTSDGNYRFLANTVFNESGKKYAVVNAYYGDLKYGSLGSNKQATGGDAVIMCYRHLSNIRMLQQFNYPVNYSIQRDLYWYQISKNGGGIEKYTSDVVVYSLESGALKRFSPVPIPAAGNYYGDTLNVVSFPSIPELHAKAKLTADDNTLSTLPDTADKTSVIYNIQLRMPSFYDTDLSSYGLICTNNGTIINLRANGLTANLDNIPDGSADDRDQIKQAVSDMIDEAVPTSSTDSPHWVNTSPFGGLVGSNKGIMGSSTETDPKHNTIKISNSSVMSGNWQSGQWKVYTVSAIGGIIGDNYGKNNHSVYGRLETTGDFAIAGWICTGGIIGYSQVDIEAEMYVDNTKDTDLAIIDFDNNVSSLLYSTTDSVGGAIGRVTSTTQFKQSVTSDPLTCTAEGSDGKINITEAPNATYQINVNLDKNSYVILEPDGTCKYDADGKLQNKRHAGIGGAIGRIESYKPGLLSVRVVNKGLITTYGNNTTNIASRSVGGAVGVVTTSANISSAFIYVENSGNIGTNVSGTAVSGVANATGGAIGKVDTLGSYEKDLMIKVVNSGKIYGDCSFSNNVTGVGGAIGTVSGPSLPKYKVCVIHNEGSSVYAKTPNLSSETDGTTSFGAGGAIGFLHYVPIGSNIYSSIGKNVTISSTGSNVGGCVGTIREKIYTSPVSTYTTFLADLSDGAAISCEGFNAGGCVGNAATVHYYTRIRARVSGTVYITAGKSAGGVAGKLNTATTSENSVISLKAISGKATLNVKAASAKNAVPDSSNRNAGGLIGYASGCDSATLLTFELPTQTGGNEVIINVDSYDNAGGVIGYFKNDAHSLAVPIRVLLHPDSHICALNSNAGGAIGKYESKIGLTANINVRDAFEVTSANTTYIRADSSSAGGCIGYAWTNGKEISSSVTLGEIITDPSSGTETIVGVSKLNICGGDIYSGTPIAGKNIGGCIGNMSNTVISGRLTVAGEHIGISGHENTGGVIGCSNTGSIGSSASLQFAASNSIINGNDASYTGGIIGYLYKVPIKDSSQLSFSGIGTSISGGDYTGGMIGCLFDVSISNSALIKYAGTDCSISGNTYTGGVFGQMNTGNTNNNVILRFEGINTSITGGKNTGGVIGSIYNASIKDSSAFYYSAKNSSITGENNTGGVFGWLYSSSKKSNGASKCIFDAEYCTIKGGVDVGGVIGYQENHENYAETKLMPKVYCSIEGSGETGGVYGHAYKNANAVKNNPQIILDNCTLNITGGGYTGGIAGLVDENAAFANSVITVKSSSSGSRSSLTITSTTSAAGGHIGRIKKDPKLDASSGMSTSVTGNSEMTVKGNSAAGGFIGLADWNVNGNVSLEVKNSSFKVNASGNGAGAGGVIGVNNGSAGIKSQGTTSLPTGGGSMEIKAPNGYAGALIGVNNSKFESHAQRLYSVTVSPMIGAVGKNNGTEKTYKFQANGGTVDIIP